MLHIPPKRGINEQGTSISLYQGGWGVGGRGKIPKPFKKNRATPTRLKKNYPTLSPESGQPKMY